MTQAPHYDFSIENGLFFDGRGGPPAVRHLGIVDGRVAVIQDWPIPRTQVGQVIDARDRWVMPGFIDLHTHYDAD